VCPSIAGTIRRVAGDGDNNQSLDPHVVIADELATWKTPKQRENLRALTTAGGGRRDPFFLFISTETDDDESEPDQAPSLGPTARAGNLARQGAPRAADEFANPTGPPLSSPTAKGSRAGARRRRLIAQAELAAD
jgi:hypothetical protein